MSAGHLQGGGPGIQMRGLVSAPPHLEAPCCSAPEDSFFVGHHSSMVRSTDLL